MTRVPGMAVVLSVVLVGLLAALGGCSSPQPPRLMVDRVVVGERTASGLVLYFEVSAENRNEVELALREARYALSLNGREVFRGVRSPEASLRRLGTQPLRFPAVVALGEGEPAPSGPTSFVIEGQLYYTNPGRIPVILYENRIYRPSSAFRESGTIDLGRE